MFFKTGATGAITTMSQTYNLAVIAGDGIGKEIMPEGLRIVKAAVNKFGLNIEFHTFEWGSCDFYETHDERNPLWWPLNTP